MCVLLELTPWNQVRVAERIRAIQTVALKVLHFGNPEPQILGSKWPNVGTIHRHWGPNVGIIYRHGAPGEAKVLKT